MGTTAASAIIVCGLFLLGLLAFEQLHDRGVAGIALLGLTVSSGIYAATCFLRLFGLQYFGNVRPSRRRHPDVPAA